MLDLEKGNRDGMERNVMVRVRRSIKGIGYYCLEVWGAKTVEARGAGVAYPCTTPQLGPKAEKDTP